MRLAFGDSPRAVHHQVEPGRHCAGVPRRVGQNLVGQDDAVPPEVVVQVLQPQQDAARGRLRHRGDVFAHLHLLAGQLVGGDPVALADALAVIDHGRQQVHEFLLGEAVVGQRPRQSLADDEPADALLDVLGSELRQSLGRALEEADRPEVGVHRAGGRGDRRELLARSLARSGQTALGHRGQVGRRGGEVSVAARQQVGVQRPREVAPNRLADRCEFGAPTGLDRFPHVAERRTPGRDRTAGTECLEELPPLFVRDTSVSMAVNHTSEIEGGSGIRR
jgi:hypothetical protein